MEQQEDALHYARISNKKQNDGFSLDAQERLGQDYADRRNLRIIKTWRVIESAWNKKRERVAFNQVIEFAKSHPKIKHIIFDITDRMTRNDIDKIKINDLIHNHGKIIHFARSNKIYDQSSSPDEIFMLDIEVAVAKKMSNDISRKVKMGMQEKAEQNLYPSIAPLAYMNIKDTKGKRIEINQAQAPHLRSVFHMMATGNYSLEMLVIHLNAAGFRTNNDCKISKSSLAHALKNPFYYGVFTWRGKQYQGSHDPLITKSVFDQVQRVLSGKHHPFINHKNFAFNNLIRCGICGCTVLGEEKRKANGVRYIYYHCSFSKGRHEPHEYVPENRLANLFEEPVRRVVITPEQAEWIREGLAIRAQSARQSHEDRLSSLQAQLSRVNQRLNKLFTDRMDGKIYDEDFARYKEAEYAAEINDLKYQIEATRKRNPNFLENGIKALELINLLYSQYLAADVHEKAVILKKLASNYVLNDATPCPTYRRPFSIFAKGPSCPTWLTR
ncbi:MAG: recombinase family protein [Candidatus Omnitrophica bacterium]|nr:recombinase family protein [Candidatus Omnitrophota bacterium]